MYQHRSTVAALRNLLLAAFAIGMSTPNAQAGENPSGVLMADKMTQVEYLGLAKYLGMSAAEVTYRMPLPRSRDPFQKKRATEALEKDVQEFSRYLASIPTGTRPLLGSNGHIIFETYHFDRGAYRACFLSNMRIKAVEPDLQTSREVKKGTPYVIHQELHFIVFSGWGSCRGGRKPDLENHTNFGIEVDLNMPADEAESIFNVIGGREVYHPAEYRCTKLSLYKRPYERFKEIRCKAMSVTTEISGMTYRFEFEATDEKVTRFDWGIVE